MKIKNILVNINNIIKIPKKKKKAGRKEKTWHNRIYMNTEIF